MRKSLRVLAGLIAVAVPGVVSIKAVAVPGDKSLKFGGVVTIDGASYEVAADNGKIKKYSDVDSLVKDVAANFPSANGNYAVSIETGLILVQSIPADLKKDAASRVVKYNTKKTAQNAVITMLDADLVLMAGWDVGNQLQQAKFNEVTAQKVAVQADVAALDALIAKYTAIANG